MEIVLWILIVILGLVALFYRSKAKEFESLFELSKGYKQTGWIAPAKGKSYEIGWPEGVDASRYTVGPRISFKLNKDGSIAKKRGRKPKVQQ